MHTVGLVVLLVIVALVAIVLALAASKPNRFAITRSILIKAPADKVFGLINDFHVWPQWSPWEAMDPEMSRTYGAVSAGLGATYDWSGKKAGVGRMEIIEQTAPIQELIKLDFFKPMKANNLAEFSLAPEGDGVRLTWTMTGASNFVHKLMSTLLNLDKLVGGDFEKGLAKLKALSEA